MADLGDLFTGTPPTYGVQMVGGGKSPLFDFAKYFGNYLKTLVGQPLPSYQGQIDPGMSPTMASLGQMLQAFSRSPLPNIMGQAGGVLGRFMNPSFANPMARMQMMGGNAPSYFGQRPPWMQGGGPMPIPPGGLPPGGPMGGLPPWMGGGGGTPPWMQPYGGGPPGGTPSLPFPGGPSGDPGGPFVGPPLMGGPAGGPTVTPSVGFDPFRRGPSVSPGGGTPPGPNMVWRPNYAIGGGLHDKPVEVGGQWVETKSNPYIGTQVPWFNNPTSMPSNPVLPPSTPTLAMPGGRGVQSIGASAVTNQTGGGPPQMGPSGGGPTNVTGGGPPQIGGSGMGNIFSRTGGFVPGVSRGGLTNVTAPPPPPSGIKNVYMPHTPAKNKSPEDNGPQKKRPRSGGNPAPRPNPRIFGSQN